jgi:protocatechuate 3,4-dioxygenase beta subunit
MTLTRLPAALLLLLCLAPPARAAELAVGGRVLDAAGKPVPGAAVELVAAPNAAERLRLDLAGRALPAPAAKATSGADGRFRLTAPGPGMWSVMVAARGFVPVEDRLEPLLEATELAPVRLAHDAGVAVRVLDVQGRPLAGARVSASLDGKSIGRVPLALLRTSWFPAPRRAATGADGRATLSRGDGESLVVTAAAAGFLAATAKNVSRAALELRLSPGCPRTVEVVDAEKRPAAQVLLAAGDTALGATGAAGRLALAAPCDRELSVRALAADGRSAAGAVRGSAAGDAAPVRIALPRRPETVSGRVLAGDSREPLAGAFVWPGDPGAAVTTDGRGGYTLQVPPGAAAPLSAAAPGYLTDYATRSAGAAAGEAGPTFALTPAATLAGSVVDEAGRPVAAAEIQAVPAPAGRGAPFFRFGRDLRTQSDGRGRFLLHVAPKQPAALTVAHDGFAPATLDAPAVEPRGAASALVVVLKKGRAAAGRALDSAQRPVAGARVTLEPAAAADMPFSSRFLRLGGEPQGFESTADASGRFAFDHLPPGRYDLAARSQGFSPLLVRGIEVPAGAGVFDLGRVLLQPGATVEGFVLDPGRRPLAGATVTANGADFPFGGGADAPAATTAADGRFVLSDLRRGDRLRLAVSLTGYASRRLAGVEVPTPQPLEVVLAPGSRVAGRVVDDAGKPVAGAGVALYRTTGGMFAGGMLPGSPAGRATTDEDGRFAIEGVEAGKIALRASARGYLEAPLDLEVAAGKDLAEVEVTLKSGAVVAGRVLGPDGAPLSGARIEVVVGQREMFSSMSGGGRATSDGDGNYRLEGIVPGQRSVAAEHPDYRRTVKDLEVRPGDNRLDLSLSRGYEVAGRLVDGTGQSIAGGRLTLGGTGGGRATAATSGGDGSFRFAGVDPGSYRLEAVKPGYAVAGRDVQVEGGPVVGLELRLDGGGAIRGRILGLDFTQLAGVQVLASGTERWQPRVGEVDYQGNYRIADLAAGDWRVTARQQGGRQAQGRATVTPGGEAVLDLQFGGGFTLTGRLVRGGEPVAGANVFLRSREVAANGSGTSNTQGEFRVEGLEPGRYQLSVLQFEAGLHYEQEVEVAGDRDLLIELPIQQVSGRVVDAADFSPIAEAEVSLEPLAQPATSAPGFGFVHRARSDGGGQFTLSDVPEGGYRVVARQDGYSPGEATVQVRTGADVDGVRLALSATSGLTLQVVGPGGSAPERVYVALLDATGRAVLASMEPTGENGRVRLTSAPPGRWRLLVGADGAGTAALAVAAPGPPVRLALPPAARLTVIVPALLDGRRIGTLTLVGADGQPYRSPSWGAVRAEFPFSDGRTTLDNLPPSTWRLRVTTPDGKSWQGSATTVPGAAAEVALK